MAKELTPKNGTHLVYEFQETSFRDTAKVLMQINGEIVGGQPVDSLIHRMKADAYKYLKCAGLTGTAGYYITACESEDDGIDLYVMATVQAYAVQHYLNILKK